MKIMLLKNEIQRLYTIKNDKETTEEKLNREKQKLNYLKKMVSCLLDKKANKKAIGKEKNERFNFLKRICYYFFLTFRILEFGIGNFCFWRDFLLLIFSLQTPFLLIGSIALSMLSSLFLYAFESSQFKLVLGLSGNPGKHQSLFLIYTKQINAVEKINRLLFDIKAIDFIPKNHYEEYIKLAYLINKDIEEKQKKIGEFHETSGKKIFRWAATLFYISLSLACTYFMGVALLTLVSVSLTNPIGLLLIGLMILATIGSRLSVQGRGIFQLINPHHLQFNALKKKLNKFEVKNEVDFQMASQIHIGLEFAHTHADPARSQKDRMQKKPYSTKQLNFFPDASPRVNPPKSTSLPFSF